MTEPELFEFKVAAKNLEDSATELQMWAFVLQRAACFDGMKTDLARAIAQVLVSADDLKELGIISSEAIDSEMMKIQNMRK